jgi:hypothetical protein
MSTISTGQARKQQRLLDDVLRAYVDWREECEEVWSTYRRWASRSAEDAGAAHCGYAAALDRERAAAEAYARLVIEVGKTAWPPT